MNTAMDVREVEPLGIGMHKQGGALLVMSAALAMTGSTACIEPAGKAEKAIAVKSKALRPTVYGKAASMQEGVRPEMESGHCHERASERLMSQKESN
jgi:hypothetical protein